MAGEPKKKHAKSKSRTRRAAKVLKSFILTTCQNCGKPAKSHTICKYCGFYKGQVVGITRAVVLKA